MNNQQMLEVLTVRLNERLKELRDIADLIQSFTVPNVDTNENYDEVLREILGIIISDKYRFSLAGLQRLQQISVSLNPTSFEDMRIKIDANMNDNQRATIEWERYVEKNVEKFFFNHDLQRGVRALRCLKPARQFYFVCRYIDVQQHDMTQLHELELVAVLLFAPEATLKELVTIFVNEHLLNETNSTFDEEVQNWLLQFVNAANVLLLAYKNKGHHITTIPDSLRLVPTNMIEEQQLRASINEQGEIAAWDMTLDKVRYILCSILWHCTYGAAHFVSSTASPYGYLQLTSDTSVSVYSVYLLALRYVLSRDVVLQTEQNPNGFSYGNVVELLEQKVKDPKQANVDTILLWITQRARTVGFFNECLQTPTTLSYDKAEMLKGAYARHIGTDFVEFTSALEKVRLQ